MACSKHKLFLINTTKYEIPNNTVDIRKYSVSVSTYVAADYNLSNVLYMYIIAFTLTDHVNIVQNKSGYEVVNNSIVNAFNNPKRSIVLDCVTVRGHENAMWEVPKTFYQSQYNITIHNVYLSTICITIVDHDVNISVSLKCISDTSKEYRIVTVTTGR